MAHDDGDSGLRVNASTTAEVTAIRGGLPACRVRRVAQYIQDNVQREVRLAELSAVVHMSPYHFSRLFRRQHRRVAVSIPGAISDRSGEGAAGGPDGAGRRDRAIGGVPEGESLHDDVSTVHRRDADHLSPCRGRGSRSARPN
jgi:hypothetical protein